MVGGARKGYCSTLSPCNARTPSKTVRIAMTMATIGRRMKNWATGYLAACFSSGLTCIPRRAFWTPSTITRSPGLHHGAHAREQAGSESPCRVGELRAYVHGACLRVERTVYEDDAALVRKEAVIRQVQLELRRLPLSSPTLVEADARGKPEIVDFGDADVDIDGVHRGDRREQRGLGLAHQIPAVDLDFPDDPRDGGLHGRVAEVQLRLGHGRFGRLHRGGGDLDLGALRELRVLERGLGPLHACRGHFLRSLACVQILLRDRPRLGQRLVAGDVTAGFVEIGLALVELGPGAIDDRDVPRPRDIGLSLGELSARGLERRRVLVRLDDEKP